MAQVEIQSETGTNLNVMHCARSPVVDTVQAWLILNKFYVCTYINHIILSRDLVGCVAMCREKRGHGLYSDGRQP